jgi:RTX calcium-binding nonapeptide repeat (4 copies)
MSYILFAKTSDASGIRSQWKTGGLTGGVADTTNWSIVNADINTAGNFGANGQALGGGSGVAAFSLDSFAPPVAGEAANGGLALSGLLGNAGTTSDFAFMGGRAAGAQVTGEATTNVLKVKMDDADWNDIKNAEIYLDNESAIREIELENFVDGRLKIGTAGADCVDPEEKDSGYSVTLTNVKRGELDASTAVAKLDAKISFYSNGDSGGDWSDTFSTKGSIFDDVVQLSGGTRVKDTSDADVGAEFTGGGATYVKTVSGTETTYHYTGNKTETATQLGYGDDAFDGRASVGGTSTEFQSKDTVWGGSGDDAIYGGGGNDILYGDFGGGVTGDPVSHTANTGEILEFEFAIKKDFAAASFHNTLGWYDKTTGEAHILSVDFTGAADGTTFKIPVSFENVGNVEFFLIEKGATRLADYFDNLYTPDTELQVQDGKIVDLTHGGKSLYEFRKPGEGYNTYFSEPGRNQDGLDHTVGDDGVDPASDGTVFQWEDLSGPRSGAEADYNDAVYTIVRPDCVDLPRTEGNDLIDGGSGNDTMMGGGGADTFVFKKGYGQDTILDFEVGIDKIDLDLADYVNLTNDGTNTLVNLVDGSKLKLASVLLASDAGLFI